MANPDKAIATQLANIEKRTGKSLAELTSIIKGSGLSKHGELVAMLKASLGMGHGDANTLVHTVLKSDGQSAAAAEGLSADQVLDGLYTGPKAALRPIHDKILTEIRKFGDFEEAPKKTYVSYRRKKQFAMIGAATNTRVEVGLNMKGVKATDRLQELPAGQMCNYKVKLTDVKDVDAELLAWIRTAYEAAG
jgi:predicted transport protein